MISNTAVQVGSSLGFGVVRTGLYASIKCFLLCWICVRKCPLMSRFLGIYSIIFTCVFQMRIFLSPIKNTSVIARSRLLSQCRVSLLGWYDLVIGSSPELTHQLLIIWKIHTGTTSLADNFFAYGKINMNQFNVNMRGCHSHRDRWEALSVSL